MSRRWASATALVAALLVLAPASAFAFEPGEYDWKWFGEVRFRPEFNDNMSGNTSRSVKDEEWRIAYASYRINFGFQVDLPRDVTVVVNSQYLGTWGDKLPVKGGPTTGTSDPYDYFYAKNGFYGSSSGDDFQLFEAYIEAKQIFGTGFNLRAGRQKLAFSDEWFLGDLDFYGGTSWDGLRGDFENTFGEFSVFWGKARETDAPEFVEAQFLGPGDAQDDADLYGAWAVIDLENRGKIDVAVMSWEDHTVTEEFRRFHYQDKRWTVLAGYHLEQDLGLQIGVNAAIQDGRTINWDRTETVGISAEAAEATVGWRWDRRGNPALVSLRGAYYSGDDPETAPNESFSAPFQDFHARYGYVDFWNGFFLSDGTDNRVYIGGQGGFWSLALHFDAQVKPGLSVFGTGLMAERAEDTNPNFSNKKLGDEFGFGARYTYSENVELELALAQLYPSFGMNAELLPGEEAQNVKRIYLNTRVRF